MGERYLPEKSEGPKRVEQWQPEQFQDYLRLLGREGYGGVESINNFPKEIDPGKDFHSMLNNLRVRAFQKIESPALVGVINKTGGLLLPDEFPYGTSRNLPPELIFDEMDKIYEQNGVNAFSCFVHSHPQGYTRFFGLHKISGRIFMKYRGFSIGDLYLTLFSKSLHFHISGVVDTQANYFAFLTRETTAIPSLENEDEDKKREFEYHWLDKYTLFKIKKKGSKPLPVHTSLWTINKGIAEEYQFALYRGKPGKDLVRNFP